jgi:hypothetical protein
MKAGGVYEALRRRHDLVDGWVLLREAFGIDMLALHTWQGKSPCYRRIAYEVKVSRADFMREIRRPEKRAYALEVSHQYFFAMPLELASWVVAEGLAPPECGVVAVFDDLRTRRVVPAQIRESRPWTERETAKLIRWRIAPNELLEAKREAHVRRKQAEWLGSKVRESAERRERAEAALERVAGDSVQPQTRWVGPWPPSPWDRQRETIEAVEVEVSRRGLSTVSIVPVERLLVPRDRFMGVGEFLASFDPA